MGLREGRRPKTVAAREAGWRQAAGLGPIANPVAEFVHRAGEAAAGAVDPGEAGGRIEDTDVGDAAVLVALKADALAAWQLGHLGQREDQELSVLADDRDHVTGGDRANPRLDRRR